MDKHITRREALRRIGLAAGAFGALSMLGACSGDKAAESTPRIAGKGKMTTRRGPKDDEVSILGYGCMRWPMMKDPDDPSREIIDQETVNELVDYAIAHGVNYFDTAPPYVRGLSEEATGTALSRHPRDSYYLATKMSNFAVGSDPAATPADVLRESKKMYHESMEKLRTDYFDYYLLHVVGMGDGMPYFNKRFITSGVLDFLEKEREAGRIRNLGFSYHGDVKCFDHCLAEHDAGRCHWDFVQIQHNYSDWHHASGENFPAEYLYNELERRGIPAVVMEPLQGGRLATLTPGLNGRLKALRPEDSIASWAFRFAATHPGILTVLSGMTYMEHLQDNIRTYSPLEPCTTEELALLEDTANKLAEFPTVPCTRCHYCMPCPYGIDIPGLFSHYNKCVNEGNTPDNVGSPDYRRARRAFLVSLDRSVEKLRQADHCIGCGQCKEHCPQTIDIPAQLHRLSEFTDNLKRNKA